MAVITVQQLKTAVAAIPAGANAWNIVVDRNLTLPVVTGVVQNADGSTSYLLRGYVHLDTLTYEAVQ